MTTERILPAPSLGGPVLGRPVLGRLTGDGAVAGVRGVPVMAPPLAQPGAHGLPAPANAGAKALRTAGATREAILDTPSRAAMLIGVSAAVYAVSLAAVAGLQAQAEAATTAAQAPVVAAVERTRAANDALEAMLVATDAQARALAAEYATVGTDAGAYQQQLDALAALVADVRGSAAALPAAISLPSVKAHGSVGGTSRAPATSGTTSASGKP